MREEKSVSKDLSDVSTNARQTLQDVSGQPTTSGKDTYKRLLRYVRPYRPQFIIAVLGMVGYALTDTAFAALMKPMLDGSFVDQDRGSILFVPLMIIGIFVLRGVAGFASTYYISWIGWRVIKQLRGEIFSKYLTFNFPDYL